MNIEYIWMGIHAHVYLKLSMQVLGEGHLCTLSQAGDLAMTYKNLGKYNDALKSEMPLLKLSE